MRTYPRCLAIMTALLTMLGAGSSAAAQTCPTTCVVDDHHWTFQNIGSTGDRIKIGMFCGSTWCQPVACEYVPSSNQWAATGFAPFNYSTRQLTADTSVCLGGGDDVVHVLAFWETLTCLGPIGGTIQVQGFDNGMRNFTISGESGNDVIMPLQHDGSMTLCGGTGLDWIEGNYDTQYIAGGGGTDLVKGGPDYDNVRGGTEGDILVHYADPGADPGVDKLRSEGGQDCIEATASFSPDSTCGDSTDWYEVGRPADCENKTPNCCTILPGLCQAQ